MYPMRLERRCLDLREDVEVVREHQVSLTKEAVIDAFEPLSPFSIRKTSVRGEDGRYPSSAGPAQRPRSKNVAVIDNMNQVQ